MTWQDANAFRVLNGSFGDQAVGRGRILGNTRGEVWPRSNEPVPVPVRPPLDLPGALTVVSDSAGDTAGGAGAEVVLVQYLDDDGYYRIGIAQLAGTTPVPVLKAALDANGVPQVTLPPTPATGVRVNRAFVVQSRNGANDAYNLGRIDVNIDIAATPQPQTSIGVGSNQNLHGSFTVPRGFAGILLSFGFSTDQNTQGEAFLVVKQPNLPPVVFIDTDVSRSSLVDSFPAARRVAQLSDVILEAERLNAAAADFTTTITYVFVPDPRDPDPNPELQPAPLG
jgi:hypothetical protein